MTEAKIVPETNEIMIFLTCNSSKFDAKKSIGKAKKLNLISMAFKAACLFIEKK